MAVETVLVLPMIKHAASDKLVSKIEGPTFPNARPICCSTDSVFFLSNRWYVCTRINMLSTPTANTKNGMTWKKKVLFLIK